MNTRLLVLAVCVGFGSLARLPAADAVSGPLTLTVSNGVKTVAWPRPLIPALETNRLTQGETPQTMVEVPATVIGTGLGGYTWTTSNALGSQFFGLTQSQMSSNALLTANALNRLAYGPTPDELPRVTAIGPQAYIDEQLAMENFGGAFEEPIENVVTLTTNAGTG